MRQYTKHLIMSIGFLMVGALVVGLLISMSATFSFKALIVPLAVFFLAGRYYGAAQGWWDIEAREEWRNTRSLKPVNLVGLLLGCGFGMQRYPRTKDDM